MPKHKVKRQEEISTAEWHKILALASALDYSQAYQIPRHNGKTLQLWFTATIAIIWLTGKRINEILTLKRKHITVTQQHIRIKFFVGKKKHRKTPIEQMPYQKVKTIKHQAVPYILEYLQQHDNIIAEPEAYLFPANTPPRTRTVNTTFTNGQGEQETRTYTYHDKGGHIYQDHARKWLKKINKQLPPNQQIYFHYGRHSIGIKMAYQGKSAIQIAAVLDETPRAAVEYTKHAGAIGEEWTNETE